MSRKLLTGAAAALTACLAVALAPTAEARPLRLAELYDLGQYLGCVDACPTVDAASTYDDHVRRQGCLADCGYAPRLWEKNGIAPVDRTDHELALLEYYDAQDPTRALVCYADVDQTIVVPAALCTGAVCEAAPECTDVECAADPNPELVCVDDLPGGPRCIWPDQKRPAHCPDVVCEAGPVHSFQECADGDGDGVPSWLEAYLGLDDGVVERRCGASSVCAFNQQCTYSPDLAAGLCTPRDCSGAPCTAFHLALVAEDDVEVIVHVYYDYTPIPARALDLYLTYDQGALTLEDARPLTPLLLQGKELAATHLSDGTLRLSVFDTGSTHPIPTGPIVELVFRRVGDGPTDIAFSHDDVLQGTSVAPLQGDAGGQALLHDDALWGPAIALTPREDVPTTLRVWYGFDSLQFPITYANVPDADALCARYPACANEPDDVERQKILTRLDALQRGSLDAKVAIDGITNGAAWLDGASDHLRMPLHFEEPLAPSAQSFSFSTWFYTEGNSADELKETPQILYSHQGANERTRFGLLLAKSPDGGMDLSLFDGDFLSRAPAPTRVPIALNLPERTWHHVGFALDADASHIDLYFDGVRVANYTFPAAPAVVCPQFFGGTDVLPHIEGNVLGGRAPEFIYYAASRSNLYRIERMDQGGLGATTILGDGQYSYRDPDYYPGLDRLVYSSNASGSFEIWLARGDGSDAQQITVGFGDATRGITARRPRWAPDGSGVVFESNVFDVLAQDNTFRRVTHLYYIAFDAADDVVAIDLPDGSTAEALDYDTLLSNQIVNTFRLTSAAQDRHHKDARWLRGRGPDGSRGELLFDASSPSFTDHGVQRLFIPEITDLASYEPVLGLGAADHEITLLAAHHSETTGLVPIVHELALFERALTEYRPSTDFTVTRTLDSAGATVRVRYAPPVQASDCWDRNHNNLQDSDEDRNDDGAWTTADCLAFEVRNLYVEYDGAAYRPVLEDAAGQPRAPGVLVTDLHKGFKLKAVEPFGHSYVRIEVLSPLDATPLVAGEIATLRFLRAGPAAPSVTFAPFARAAQVDHFIKDLTTVATPTLFPTAGLFEQIDDAAFAPDGQSLLLAAISRSRPVLLRTENLLGAAGAASLLVDPTRLGGLDWVRQERFSPCNWVGGVQHLQHKRILSALRGGLDDLKIYAGLRDPDAFRSEAERGIERLVRDGRDGQLASLLPSCGNSHAECPPYHLCVASECVTVPCDPEDPYSCANTQSRCTLRPLPVEQENVGQGGDPSAFDWVCAADCSVDAQCFTEACLNGPCRFCAPEEHACIECRDVVKDLGALTIATMEGCPDTKSFECVAGACQTECYSFEDGQSVYLCDPVLEYCHQGKCVMHDWTWWDFAPASFAGGSPARYDVPTDPQSGWPGYAQVVDQRVAIAISAYGVQDYGQSPELVVEAKGGPFYGGTWHRIARVMVHNSTAVEANANPYVVSSPHPFNDLRMRLITAPYQNLTGAASGFGAKDDQFCLADFARTAAAAGTPGAAPDPCYYQAQGSRYTVGYRVELPEHEAISFCRAHLHAGCPTISQGEHDFLWGGQPAVAVLDVTVDGGSAMNNITRDRVCSYEGGMLPIDNGVPKKVFYGDIARERSNEKAAFCAANPAACAAPTGLLEFDRATYGYAVLNCNVVDPVTGDNAELLLQNIIIYRDWPLESGAVLETANNCTVDVDAFRTEPCYTWTGGDTSLDPNNATQGAGASVVFASFEFGLFKNFGHDEGFTSVAVPHASLEVRFFGDLGDGIQVGWKDSRGAIADLLEIAPGTTAATFPTTMPYGRRYEVFIARQPSAANVSCLISGAGSGAMPSAGATVDVVCSVTHPVNVAVQGLTGELVLTNRYRLGAGLPVAGLDELRVTTSGVASFGRTLPTGGEYQVSVTRQPAGQVCAVQGGSGQVYSGAVGVVVTCRSVAMVALQVDVSGVAGGGLVLIERTSGRTIAVAANGRVAFPGQFMEGVGYDIAVSSQPGDPAQLCQVTGGGAGAVGTTATLGAAVTCTTLPTYFVSGQIIGLAGDGLALALNGAGTLTFDGPASIDEVVDFTFEAELLHDAAYLVTVVGQPESPAQICTPILAGGRINHGDVTGVTIICQPPAPTTEIYYVGGTVSGLAGTGLRLVLTSGVERLVVAQNGPFAFALSHLPDTDFTVTIDRQPSNPTQVCAVARGEGTVEHADITDVAVTCVSAMKVTVELNAASSNGAQVKALLVTTEARPRLVARSPSSAQVSAGRALFVMRELGSDAEAALPPGQYKLYVFLNRDLDYDADTGAAHYEPVNDSGAVIAVGGTALQPPTVVISQSQLQPLGYGAIKVVSPSLDDHASVRCWLAAAGAGLQVVPPFADTPVIGTSARACPTSGDACTQGSGGSKSLTTNRFTPVPTGVPYDVACWVDADTDNTMSAGDLFGTLSGVPTTTPLTLTLNALSF
ncbi:MAG: hypothetical protein CVU56_17485 [Deltaproteobacteria bacterium HGW-Deltaproteobacteria-14]|jgi:hypothetical protein|nr:MAG: hypothetical protein CVU56_17485 [Deltaproteobacteria bacterium HGW-Deltaproteobacteria-14]